MKKVIIVGGGWAGCAAAIAARKAGCDVVVYERADMLLGTGLVGGIMRNNGRFTATEEMLAMGCGDLFSVCDNNSRHKNIEFPGHKHASLYDVSLIEPAVRQCLLHADVKIHVMTKVKGVKAENGSILGLTIEHFETGEISEVEADAYVDASGTAGPQGNCTKHGNGCTMCIYRCPTFGPRMGIAAKAGIEERIAEKADGSLGAMSGSCKLHKDSLSKEIREELDATGVCVVPIPSALRKSMSQMGQKACQQYALPEYSENIVLLDTGHAKLMSSYYPLDILRQISGFANARYEDPYSGGIGNSMRYFGMSPRTDDLKVIGLANTFCAGEKVGPLVGHTEAIVTGVLAGHNAARHAYGKKYVEIPRSLMIGESISFVRESIVTKEGISKKYTFSGSVLLNHLKEKGMYTTDVAAIRKAVDAAGMTGFFAKSVM